MYMQPFIFTLNYSVNYGAFLQTFALENFSSNFKTADLSPSVKFAICRKVDDKNKRKLPFFWTGLALYRYLKNKKRIMPPFSENKMLHLTPQIMKLSRKQCSNLLDNSIAICGSDQIWNPEFIKGREKFFFADVANFSKRISYAASLGVPKWPAKFESEMLPLLKKFDAISVREESSVNYLLSLGLKNVVCVCDPTILHKAEFYRENFQIISIMQQRYTFVYRIRETIPNNLQMLLGNYVEVRLDRKDLPSISQWLSYIDNAEFVVTDSFHCVVFCVLFHKKFVVLENNTTLKGMNERFSNLLGRLDLEYRCLNFSESPTEILDIISKKIDWEWVDSTLDEWRNNSSNWLKKALEEQ